MKKIFYIILSVISVMACYPLEPITFDQLSSDNVLNTEDDVKTAVTGLYHELRGSGWEQYNCAWGSLLTMEVGCTDECDCNWVWDVQLNYMWKAETSDMALFYTEMMPAVTKATALLAKLKRVSISAPKKRKYTAEIRCLRAIWAYDLYDLYGTVPIVTDPDIALYPEKASDYYPERPTVDWYVDFVQTELEECIENLPEANELLESEWGHMTKGIAKMYLIKLYMHEAGQETYHRGHPEKAREWWEKVAALSLEIINSNQYTLMEDYMSIWSPDNQKNKEVIFPIPCFPTGGLGNCFLAHALPADYESKSGIALTKWGGFLVPWDFYDTYASDDKRRNALMTHYWNGSYEVDRRTEYTGKPGAIPMKYQENASTTGQWDASDYVIDRYAEVLLARAEALNELDGPTDEAKALLHQIRRRAFDNYEGSAHQSEIDDISDKNAFRDHILDERGWEFCWEGMRRPDLIRHGKLISNAQARGKIMAEDKHNLYAIPQKALYENPNLVQNDGF
ncbi:MAG: RagB/SusD family nutrient uptake outer membrane protein [Bacteroidales bacterium]|nr:RagB/SusD family nutrient uptake outer membrane protein [Candidatus Cryptobacteroides aphodequi]